MRRQFLAMFVLSTSIALAANGCGSSGPQLAKVTGSVTKGGKLQQGVNVAFVPADLKQGSTVGSRTDSDGKFEVLVKPGSYTVALTKMVDKNGKVPKDSENPAEDYVMLEAAGQLRQVLPAKYTSVDSSPFKVDIPAEGKDLPAFDVK